MTDFAEPTKPVPIEDLKNELQNLCEENQIIKFEPDEIVELIGDGEEVDWILDQLALTDAGVSSQIQELLTRIKLQIHPEAGELALETPEALEEPELAPAEETEEKPLDFSKMELPEGFKLPPGMNMQKFQEMMESPQGNFMADFSLFCQEKGVMPTGTDKGSIKAIKALQEEWLKMPRESFEGKTPQQMIDENPELAMPQKVETIRREQPKVGRNEPCPCGSGKKYKKCCGREE